MARLIQNRRQNRVSQSNTSRKDMERCQQVCFVFIVVEEANLRSGKGPFPLQQGLNWNAHHIDDYIGEATALVQDAAKSLGTLQRNTATVRAMLKQWQTELMFERKEGKVTSPCSHCLIAFAPPHHDHPPPVPCLTCLCLS